MPCKLWQLCLLCCAWRSSIAIDSGILPQPDDFEAQVDEGMQITAPLASLLLSFALLLPPSSATPPSKSSKPQQSASSGKQLYAVRGEIIARKSPAKGWLQLTIKSKDATETIISVRENDLVGNAVSRSGDTDLAGLLSGSDRAAETITAAELETGDVVSVIYDPQQQNRALEIYLH